MVQALGAMPQGLGIFECKQQTLRSPALAGHGSQTADWTGEEDDGMNETICPCDFQHVSSLLHFSCLFKGVGCLALPGYLRAFSMCCFQALHMPR